MSENVRKMGREAAILALACGETVSDAARKAGVVERTIYRWLKEEGFRQEIATARAEMFNRALGRLAEGAVASVLMLRQLCLKAKSEAVRLAAARTILEQGTKVRESVEFEHRLQALEQNLNAGKRK
jgi:transposase-like protein